MQKLGPYKGYTGNCEVLLEEGLLYGTVQDVRAVVDYKAPTVAELKEAFKDSVDAYLEMCEEIGCEPDQPHSGKILLRTSSELHRRATENAMRNNMSLNAFIEQAVEEKLRTRTMVIEFSERKGRSHGGYRRLVATQPLEVAGEINANLLNFKDMFKAYLSHALPNDDLKSLEGFQPHGQSTVCDAPARRQ